MAVVRREGEWRLEKTDEGIYEVTYDRQAEVKIVTPEYSPTGFADERREFAIQVREVDSFSEAKSVFEEHAAGGAPRAGFGTGLGGGGGGSSGGSEFDSFEAADLEDVPAGAVVLVSLFLGGYLLFRNGFAPDSNVFLFAAGLVTVGIGGLGWTYVLYQRKGMGAATEFLVSTGDDSASTTDDETEKTPRAPESLRNELFFGRADQNCEWCGDSTDNPEVHHIEPRSEGGPATPRNLIVLCPSCHSKADQGVPSRTKLKHKVRRLETARS